MSQKNYVLYAHDGSGNHGCEALVRSTCAILGANKENVVLMSTRPEEDEKYGLSKFSESLIPRISQNPQKISIYPEKSA